jgi:RNA polymerase sigma-70 factor (ECF subfamily)
MEATLSHSVEPSRAALIRAACAGDGEAFAGLVRPSLAAAVGTATLVTGSPADGADAVQEALVSAWKGLPSLRDPAAFPAWFRRHVVRSALRIAGQGRRHGIVEVHLSDREDDGSPVDGSELEREVERRLLDRAFDRLEPKDRLVLTLRHYCDLPVAEIAAALEVAPGTVKSRVHTALRRLRAAYEAEERR